MRYVGRAQDQIDRLETALSELAAEAAKAGAYEETATIAGMAGKIAALRVGLGRVALSRAETRTASGPARDVGRRVHASSTAKAKPVPVSANYPRFERRSDDLVKVGYSASDGGEYEHRAPKRAVDDVVRELERRSAGQALVATAQLLPVISPRDGAEVPVYQVYVTLAWLREAAVIEAVGRRGYRLTAAGSLRESVNRLWSGLEVPETN